MAILFSGTPRPLRAALQEGRPWAVPSASVAPEFHDAVASARDLARDFMEERGIPGLSVAVWKEGRIVWSEGFGWANVETGTPVTPHSRFRGGSTAKPMTAALLMRLVERGAIDLDLPIHHHLPEHPRGEHEITARQLAGHIAGIRHYPPDGTEFLNPVRYTTVFESLEIFLNDPLLFEPGTAYSYSSYGWNLLSALIERAAEEPFLDLMHREVFEPLGMRATLADHTDSIVAGRVGFYERTGGIPSYRTRATGWGDGEGIGALFNAPYTDNSNKWAGGGFLTTPEDLVRLGAAHLPGSGFFPDSILREMQTPMQLADGTFTAYGIGWQLGEEGTAGRTFGHSGGSVGGTTDLRAYPEEGLVIAVQANLSNAGIGTLTGRIAERFLASR